MCAAQVPSRALPGKPRVDRPANLLHASTFAGAHRGECLPQALLLFVRELRNIVRGLDDMATSRQVT